MDKSILDEKRSLLLSDYTPKYEQLYIHPEEGEDFRINTALQDIKSDIDKIDNLLIDKGNAVSTLLSDTITRLDLVKDKILAEKERIQDIKMLCNKYTDFDKVITINDKNSTGQYSYTDNSFLSYIKSYKKNTLYINDVVGNGNEGNPYVYLNGTYVQYSINTADRKSLSDNSINSYWEYQRITASTTEQYLIHDFYTDSEEAKCTITMSSSTKMNELQIMTPIDSTKVIGLQYSNDGVNYTAATIPDITFDKLDSYENTGYIYGSSLISVPNCYFVKLTLQSNSSNNDTIAYERTMFKDETFNEDEVNDTKTETTFIQSAKRHVIKINDLYSYSNQYINTSYFTTDNLVDGTDDVYAVSVFANVYIPSQLSDDSVEFTLTVNGIDYEVQPINSELDGVKVIRYSKGKSKTEYTELTDEVINSVILTVKIKSAKNLTPYINNVKVLLGGEV